LSKKLGSPPSLDTYNSHGTCSYPWSSYPYFFRKKQILYGPDNIVKIATSVSIQLITRTSPISAVAIFAFKGGKGLATKAEAG
jgi:hypothetical protein